MKTLTRAEEQVMQTVWKIKEGFIRDIMDALPAPKPHQNTIATILKILVEKEFVGIRIFGRQHQYYPLVSKEAYSKTTMKSLVKGYFEGSPAKLLSHFVNENKLSQEELEALLEQIKNAKNHNQ